MWPTNPLTCFTKLPTEVVMTEEITGVTSVNTKQPVDVNIVISIRYSDLKAHTAVKTGGNARERCSQGR